MENIWKTSSTVYGAILSTLKNTANQMIMWKKGKKRDSTKLHIRQNLLIKKELQLIDSQINRWDIKEL